MKKDGMSTIYKLISEKLENAPSEENASKQENDIYNEMQNLKEALREYLEIQKDNYDSEIINEDNINDYRDEIDGNINEVVKCYVLNLIETSYPEILKNNLLTKVKLEKIATKISDNEKFNDYLDGLMFEEIDKNFNIDELEEDIDCEQS